MKRGDTFTLEGFGDFLVDAINGDYVKGRWKTGPLAGREARCSRKALEGRDLTTAPPVRRESKKAREALQGALLDDLREAPVGLREWAVRTGREEREVRGAIGALRRSGHAIRSLGGGKFEL
jgi:hypothetical protein